ncbi:MAG: ATP-dependent Clp protease ATP-binding subunit [Deltaproteobacteria bacterium]|nr:ATP-dependent Clp protease ATP-binding subunit [Deltaproteobacteria bacterium]
MAAGLTGLINNAKRAAQRRGQKASTVHLLLTLFQEDCQTGVLLAQQGVREIDLIKSLAEVAEEPASAIELAEERAEKIAEAVGDSPPRAIHLLLAIARDSRSAGYRCLERIGTRASAVHGGALAVLESSGCAVERLNGRDNAETNIKRSRGVQLSFPHTPPLRTNHWVSREDENRVKAKKRAKNTFHPVNVRPESPKKVISIEPATPTAETASESHAEKSSEPVNRYELERRRYPTLFALGRNLMVAASNNEIDPVIGRQREIEQLLDVLARRRANNPLLVGPSGVGKTAIVEGLALWLVQSEPESGALAERIIVEISISALLSGTGVRGALAEKLRALRAEVASSNGRVLLFIDEIHTLVGTPEGADGLTNELKIALARGQLPCIGATTESEYRRLFERDVALARRFTRIDIQQPKPADAIKILKGISLQYEKHHRVAYQPQALESAVEMSVRYLSERQLPEKAISVIDQAAARIRRRGGKIVDETAVAQVISEQTKVPIERLMMRDADRLLLLDKHLEKRVIGQREAISRIAPALRKSAAGFRGARPLGTFLFLGPTGVGKTEMAKAINELLFPTSEMTRFDMSEFSEPHSVARLLGAPPGYIGHDEGGQLTEAVRSRPYQLILLDEIDKAHPEVLLSLLPLLDEGRLTDSRGRTVDFTNAVIAMTSNLGAAVQRNKMAIGFSADHDRNNDARLAKRALAEARAALPPELWNRIDEPLYFYPLGEQEIAAIARRFVDQAAQIAFDRYAIILEIDPSVISTLAAAGGFDPLLGARPMKRTVGRLVEAPLADAILSERFASGDELLLRGDGDKVTIELKTGTEQPLCCA